MKTITTILGCALLLLAGCDVKDPICNTPHPEEGAVNLSADWSARGEGVKIPVMYTAEVNGTATVLTANPAVLPGLFTPGTLKVYAWNIPQGFTITNGKATLAEAADSPGLFTSQAEWLFTGSTDITVIADDTVDAILPMRQQMRLLCIELTVTEGEYDRITGIEATLSGIATTVDLYTGTLTDGTGTVSLSFTRTGNKIKGEACLPGISDTAQELTVTFSFEDNEPAPQTTRNDLSQLLAGFNNGKLIPVTLTGNFYSPNRTDLGSAVIDWTSGNGDKGQNGSATEQ